MNLSTESQDTDCSAPFVQARIEASLNSESFEVPQGLSALEIEKFIVSKAQIGAMKIEPGGMQ